MKDVQSSHSDWMLVAKSKLIVVGTLVHSKGVDPIASATNGAYQTAEVLHPVVIKGESPQGSLMVFLSASDTVAWGEKSVLYLDFVEMAPVSGFYLADDFPVAIHSYSLELIERIKEVEEENVSFMKKGESFCPPGGDLVALGIKKDIEALANIETQQKAVRSLLNRGDQAMPYLVCYMDDWRKFGAGALTLPGGNKSAFEAAQHYSPVLMVDAIDAILSRITKTSFGFIGNGATDEKRKVVLDSWRIYLGRSLSANNN